MIEVTCLDCNCEWQTEELTPKRNEQARSGLILCPQCYSSRWAVLVRPTAFIDADMMAWLIQWHFLEEDPLALLAMVTIGPKENRA